MEIPKSNRVSGTVVVDACYSCGCGFKTASTEEAKGHVANTKHRMTIAGAVWYDGSKPTTVELGQAAATTLPTIERKIG